MNTEGHVLVIGASNLDIKGQPDEPMIRKTSIPGHIRSSLGGVARNIAENLVRLEVETVLVTVVGDDEAGERILGHAAGRGIDITEALVVEGAHTGAYMVLLDKNGALDVAIDDMKIMDHLTPGYLLNRQYLFDDASMVAIDANLTPDVLQVVMKLSSERGLPVCADPTSAKLAARIRPHLSSLYMASPNVPETVALCDVDFDESNREAAQTAARRLVGLGVDVSVITLGEHGVAYADAETHGYIPAVPTKVVDQTGAGDAMTAAIIFGLLEEIPLDECVRLGVAAATLTLQTSYSVLPRLSVDLLYDELSV